METDFSVNIARASSPKLLNHGRPLGRISIIKHITKDHSEDKTGRDGIPGVPLSVDNILLPKSS
jgi:hypothetical protein